MISSSQSEVTTLTSKVFPAISKHASISARKFQNRYRRLVLVLVLIASSYSLLNLIENRRTQMAIALVLTSVQLSTTLINASLGWNKKWYQARALAESTKSVTWRYAVGGLPFPAELELPEARGKLAQSVMDLVDTLGEVSFLNARHIPIEEDMSEVEKLRVSSLENRQEVYVRDRLQDQEKWYALKAIELSKKRQLLNTCAFLSSILAIAISIYLLIEPASISYAFVSFFASAALGVITIGQSYNLATDITAYQVTHYEIKRILALVLPDNDQEWAQWVDDKEEALSREHVMWLASRAHIGTTK